MIVEDLLACKLSMSLTINDYFGGGDVEGLNVFGNDGLELGLLGGSGDLVGGP